MANISKPTRLDLFEKDIIPLKVKNVLGLGTVISYLVEKPYTEMSTLRYHQCKLLVIYPNGSVGEIKTVMPVDTFTPIGKDKIYYSCCNQANDTYQIRCISSNGKDTFIAGEELKFDYYYELIDDQYYLNQDETCFTEIMDMTTSSEGECVVLEKNGVVRKLRDDATTEFLAKGFVVPSSIIAKPKGKGYLVVDSYGITHLKDDGRIIQIFRSKITAFINSMVHLPNKILISGYARRTINTINPKHKMIEQDFMTKKRFDNMKIGNVFRGFHIDLKGNLIIWTERGLFLDQKETIAPRPIIPYRVLSCQMWNFKTVSLRNYPRVLYQYAMTLMLCFDRFFKENMDTNFPIEIGHIILSLADAWQFPKKSLTYWQ
tara:strand:+ start:567 stop:1688 length:1122 start_codon:yes stop_codon:yes gene_type:complete